jgi:hypothetical protein
MHKAMGTMKQWKRNGQEQYEPANQAGNQSHDNRRAIELDARESAGGNEWDGDPRHKDEYGYEQCRKHAAYGEQRPPNDLTGCLCHPSIPCVQSAVSYADAD